MNNETISTDMFLKFLNFVFLDPEWTQRKKTFSNDALEQFPFRQEIELLMMAFKVIDDDSEVKNIFVLIQGYEEYEGHYLTITLSDYFWNFVCAKRSKQIGDQSDEEGRYNVQ